VNQSLWNLVGVWSCVGVVAWLIRRGLNWLDLLHVIHSHNSGLQVLRRYRCSAHFAVLRYTQTHWGSQSSLAVFCQRTDNSLTAISHHTWSLFSTACLFLTFFCSCQFGKLDPILIPLHPSSYPGRLASRNSSIHFSTTVLCCRTLLYNVFARTTQKTVSVVKEACLLIRSLLLRALAPAGMCLLNRCLAVGLYVTILWHQRLCQWRTS
jgi:hypothetical protein